MTGLLIENHIIDIFDCISVSKNPFYFKTKEFLRQSKDLNQLLKESPNGKSLAKLGFSMDVDFAIKLNKIKSVPKIKEYKKLEGMSFCAIV